MGDVRVAVIGAGVMGERHARTYAALPGVRVAAVCDVREESAHRVAGLVGAAAETDLAAVLARDDVDAVSICTPDGDHRAPAEAAARAGKPVLLEKPIATTVADAEAIIEAFERAGTVLLVGHCLRFDPRYHALQAAVAAGEIGPVQTVYARRSNTVAAQDRLKGRCSLPLFLGVHDYDVLRWVTGSEVERVTAESRWGLLQGLGYPVEDATGALLQLRSGALAIVDLNWILPRGWPAGGDHRLDVIGDRGALGLATLETGLRRVDGQRLTQLDPGLAPTIHGHGGGMFHYQLAHFLDCVQGTARPAVSPHDGLMALRIALAVERAAASGRPASP